MSAKLRRAVCSALKSDGLAAETFRARFLEEPADAPFPHVAVAAALEGTAILHVRSRELGRRQAQVLSGIVLEALDAALGGVSTSTIHLEGDGRTWCGVITWQG